MADEALERITILLQAKDAEFQRAMEKNNRVIAKFARQAEKDSSAATRTISDNLRAATAGAASFGSSFVKGLAVGAITAAFAAMTTGIRGTIADIADMVDAADRIGLSAEQFQSLQFGMQQAGVSAAEFSAGMEKLSENIGDAARGSGTFGEIAAANGIAIKDAGGNIRSTTDILADFADLIRRTPDEAARLSLITEAFGRGGKAMVLALAGGSAGLKEMQVAAQEAGVVINEEVAQKAAELDDKFEVLTARISTLFKTWAVDASAAAAALAEAAQQNMAGATSQAVRDLAYEHEALTDAANKASEAIGNEAGVFVEAGFPALAQDVADISTHMQQLAIDLRDNGMTAEDFAAAIVVDIDKAELLLRSLDNIDGIDMSNALSVLASLGGRLATLKAQADDAAHAVWSASMMGRNPASGFNAPGPSTSMNFPEYGGKTRSPYGSIPSGLGTAPIVPDVGGSGRGKGGGGGGGITDAQRDAAKWFEATRTEADKYAKEVAELNLLLDEGLITQDTFNRGLEQTKGKYLEVGDAAEYLKGVNKDMKEAFLDLALDGVNSFDAIAKSIKRAALEALVFGSGPLSGIMGGKGGGLIGGLFGLITGKRASGGGVNSGSAYAINENTPNSEIFVPSRNGAVLNVPQAQAALRGQGGALAITVTMDASTGALGAFVTDTAGRVVARAAPGIASAAVRQSVELSRETGAFK
jgi:hypothetical protein